MMNVYKKNCKQICLIRLFDNLCPGDNKKRNKTNALCIDGVRQKLYVLKKPTCLWSH